jgi:hypothetical protein
MLEREAVLETTVRGRVEDVADVGATDSRASIMAGQGVDDQELDEGNKEQNDALESAIQQAPARNQSRVTG